MGTVITAKEWKRIRQQQRLEDEVRQRQAHEKREAERNALISSVFDLWAARDAKAKEEQERARKLAQLITRIKVVDGVTIGYDAEDNILAAVPGRATAIELIAEMHGQLKEFRDFQAGIDHTTYRGHAVLRGGKWSVKADCGDRLIHIGSFEDEQTARTVASQIIKATREEVEMFRSRYMRKHNVRRQPKVKKEFA